MLNPGRYTIFTTAGVVMQCNSMQEMVISLEATPFKLSNTAPIVFRNGKVVHYFDLDDIPDLLATSKHGWTLHSSLQSPVHAATLRELAIISLITPGYQYWRISYGNAVRALPNRVSCAMLYCEAGQIGFLDLGYN